MRTTGNEADDGNKDVKKSDRFNEKTILYMQHTFLCISLPSLHDHHVEFSDATLYGGI